MIILDGSASIVPSDWLKALDFANKVVDGFNVSADQAEIGVVQFASQATLEIGLSADKAKIHSTITNMREMKQNTNTYEGFKVAQDELHAHGRTGTNASIVILLTDGKQNQGRPASIVADDLKANDKATIFGIGVGPSIDERELQSWCSTPLSSHYFKVSDWTALEQVLNKILEDACPKPPPPPARRLRNPGDHCKFHLPSPLPTRAAVTSAARVAIVEEPAAPVVEGAFSMAAADPSNVSDPCNPFGDCATCIGARTSTGQTCGWCTGDLKYNGESAKSAFHCAGKDAGNSSAKFTCSGHFQTTSCEVPGDCGLKGIYRGLRIDNAYDFGEWSAVFTPQTLGPNGTVSGEMVTISQLDASGKAASTIEGIVECESKCSAQNASSIAGAKFKLTATSGQIYRGICGYTDQIQAETSGLMWAMSNQGVATAPADFDVAMNGTTATVHTYYKCAEFKGSTCTFTAP